MVAKGLRYKRDVEWGLFLEVGLCLKGNRVLKGFISNRGYVFGVDYLEISTLLFFFQSHYCIRHESRIRKITVLILDDDLSNLSFYCYLSLVGKN